ncbi:MAG: peptidase dimerization domain-containing protein, partial [Planctomycetota bacterium]
TWELKAGPLPARAEICHVTVAGLRGGHSGCDIHLNRGSAVKLLVQALRGANQKQLRLVSLSAGSKRNVIPRESAAVVVGPRGTATRLRSSAEQVEAEATRAFGETGCALHVAQWTGADAAGAAAPRDTERVLAALTGLPHGVLAVVPEIAGLVQTSNSVSTIESQRENGVLRVTVGCLSRSSSMVQLQLAAQQIAAIGRLADAGVEHGNAYPGWQPNVDSPLLATCQRIYTSLFSAGPRVTAIHAGLECGIIGERMGDMDMISFGPHITGAHSPDERVYVESVRKIWAFLKAVLAELAKA